MIDLNSAASMPLGLYVHLPWCVRKCPYCDFNSHQLRETIPAQDYIACLIADLEHDAGLVEDREISSIYFGGGTPSLFNAQQLAELLEGIGQKTNVAAHAEVSLEANPGTIEHDSFKAYAEAGINRVSLGAQSFNDDCLKRIGRIHGRSEVDTSLESLRFSGINNFNIDLMFGLPGQQEDQAIKDIRCAIDAGATHISHYQLTIEPNTAFSASPPVLPVSDASAAMQDAAAGLLNEAGYRQYEISAWAKPGMGCQHNLNYWRYGDFLGIGAGAHAKLSSSDGQIRRMAKTRHPSRYMGGEFLAEKRKIVGDEIVFEYFLNKLRLHEPICADDFELKTGLSWKRARKGVEAALQRGLLEQSGRELVHTEAGWRFVNDIQVLFLP